MTIARAFVMIAVISQLTAMAHAQTASRQIANVQVVMFEIYGPDATRLINADPGTRTYLLTDASRKQLGEVQRFDLIVDGGSHSENRQVLPSGPGVYIDRRTLSATRVQQTQRWMNVQWSNYGPNMNVEASLAVVTGWSRADGKLDDPVAVETVVSGKVPLGQGPQVLLQQASPDPLRGARVLALLISQ